MSTLVETIASRLDNAWQTHTPIPPITESDGITDVNIAYAIQTHWTKMRLDRGERIAGSQDRFNKQGDTNTIGGQRTGLWEPVGIQFLRSKKWKSEYTGW